MARRARTRTVAAAAETGLRVAIYVRRSTDEEHQPFSIEAQDSRLRSYVKSQPGWSLVARFEDDASGAKLDRPGLEKALAAARAGRFDVLLVYRVDRFTRRISDLAILPCGPSASDVWALTSSLELVESARSLRESLRACIVITRKQPRTSLGRDARSVLESSGLTVLSSELLYRVAYQEALAAGTGVTGRRRDAAASEVQRLFEEVEKLVYAEKKSGCYPAQALASA